MAMQKMTPAENPDAYVAALAGWRRAVVEALRSAVCGSSALDERIKWGHLVYFSNGPVLLIRAEEERVLFGFWRGQRLREIEPRLKPGGKYEMATLELREDTNFDPAKARQLAKAAIELNRTRGDPTLDAKPAAKSAAKSAAKPAAKPARRAGSPKVAVLPTGVKKKRP